MIDCTLGAGGHAEGALHRFPTLSVVGIDHDPISELKRQHYEFRGASILAKKVWSGAQSSDPIAAVRSFIRHDPDAVARQLMRIYFA